MMGLSTKKKYFVHLLAIACAVVFSALLFQAKTTPKGAKFETKGFSIHRICIGMKRTIVEEILGKPVESSAGYGEYPAPGVINVSVKYSTDQLVEAFASPMRVNSKGELQVVTGAGTRFLLPIGTSKSKVESILGQPQDTTSGNTLYRVTELIGVEVSFDANSYVNSVCGLQLERDGRVLIEPHSNIQHMEKVLGPPDSRDSLNCYFTLPKCIISITEGHTGLIQLQDNSKIPSLPSPSNSIKD